VGVTLEADLKDSAAWTKDMDEFNYQMTWASWAVGVKKDPESMWSSKEADRVSGNNITGFKNPRVDELIEQTKTIFDIGARHELVRQIDQIAYTEYPYALLWNINYARLLYWNKFGTPSTVLSKFGSTNSAVAYWWFDEDSAADLEDAQKTGGNLPARPFEVDFDKTFKGK
jgi:microcin C transport system substrate-binding protein